MAKYILRGNISTDDDFHFELLPEEVTRDWDGNYTIKLETDDFEYAKKRAAFILDTLNKQFRSATHNYIKGHFSKMVDGAIDSIDKWKYFGYMGGNYEGTHIDLVINERPFEIGTRMTEEEYAIYKDWAELPETIRAGRIELQAQFIINGINAMKE